MHRVAGRDVAAGRFSVNSSQRPDGSLIQPPTAAVKTVQNMLKKDGATQGEISSAVTRLENLPEGSRVRVANRIEALKATLDAVYPVLSSRGIEPRAPLKMAYEYLARQLRKKIFHPYFDRVRSALADSGMAARSYSVEESRVRDGKCAPFHGLAVKNEDRSVIVKIRLFGYLCYTVRFFGLQIVGGQSHHYALHLDGNREVWDHIESA